MASRPPSRCAPPGRTSPCGPKTVRTHDPVQPAPPGDVPSLDPHTDDVRLELRIIPVVAGEVGYQGRNRVAEQRQLYRHAYLRLRSPDSRTPSPYHLPRHLWNGVGEESHSGPSRHAETGEARNRLEDPDPA